MTRSGATLVVVAALLTATQATPPAMAQSALFAPSQSVHEVLAAKTLYQSGPILVHAQALFLEHGIVLIDDKCSLNCDEAVGLNVPHEVDAKLNGQFLPRSWHGHMPDNDNRLYMKISVILIYKHRAALAGRPPTPLSVAEFRLVDIVGEGRRRFR